MNNTTFDLQTPEGRAAIRKHLDKQTREIGLQGYALHDEAIQAVLGDLAALKQSDSPSIQDILNSARNGLSLINQANRLLDLIDTVEQRTPDFNETWEPKDEVRQQRPAWFIDYWLPADDLTLLSGRGGTGKSTLALQLGCKLATGYPGDYLKPEDGVKPNNNDRCPVVFASWEMSLWELKNRILDIGYALPWADYDALHDSLFLVDMMKAGPFWGPTHGKHHSTRAGLLPGGEQLLEYCEQKKADLLIIDPTTRAYRSPDIDKEGVAEFCTYIQQWAREHNCAVLIIQHPPRSEKEDDDAFGGTAAWRDCCRAAWTLRLYKEKTNNDNQESDTYHYLYRMKANNAPPRKENKRYLAHVQKSRGIWEAVDKHEAIQRHKNWGVK